MRWAWADEMTSTCLIGSPLSGWVIPLAQIPDPVFAQGMAGDGLAIDPTGSLLCAPFDGIVRCNPANAHAMSICSPDGIEVLMHVGIDTVLLKGQGFRPLVADGDTVKAGQALLEFDLDLVAGRAASAVTPVLLVSGNARIIQRNVNTAIAVGDVLYEVERATGQETAIENTDGTIRSTLTVTFEQGMHARPAAALAAVLRPYKSDVQLVLDSKRANARSMVAVMSLGIKHGDVIDLDVAGSDAEEASAAALGFFSAEAKNHGHEQLQQAGNTTAQPVNGIIQAVIASRGLAVGKAFHLVSHVIAVPEQGTGIEAELQSLQSALNRLKSHLTLQLGDDADHRHKILEAHIGLLADPALYEHAERLIRQGKSAGFAWRQATSSVVSTLAAMDNAYMKERIADFRDIEQGLLKALAGQDLADVDHLPDQCILIVDELLPSQLLAYDPGRIAGICSSGGGPSAHAAIIAASLGIPFLVAAGSFVHDINTDVMLILDAENGCLHLAPDALTLAAVTQRIARRKEQAAGDMAWAQLPALSQDGVPVNVYANLGGSSEVADALTAGAEGCGLFRTEFLFMDRQHAPGEEEQFRIYSEILCRMPDKPLTIRTMDIGGDKPIAYLPLPKEENPALGLRGLRTSLWRDQLFIDQLRAILRLPRPNQVRILLPMVNDVGDIAQARHYIDQCALDLGLDGLPEIGAMIETPASAMMLDQLLGVVDFVSIGSNDLSQYVLAIDRGHPVLASKLDALHPAVLRMIKHVAESGRRAGKKVSLCGGLASDPIAIPVLLGMDLLELSAVPAMIPRIKNLIRHLDIKACHDFVGQALASGDAASVRKLSTEFIAQAEQGA